MMVPENLTQPLLSSDVACEHYIMAETDRSTCAAEPHCRGDENLVGALTCHVEVGSLRAALQLQQSSDDTTKLMGKSREKQSEKKIKIVTAMH